MATINIQSLYDQTLAVKAAGNTAFKSGDLELALKNYGQMFTNIDLLQRKTDELRVNSLNNQAAVYMKMNNWKKCKECCDKVFEYDENNLKALYRRGIAYRKLDLCDLARIDFDKATGISPHKSNPEIEREIELLPKPRVHDEKGHSKPDFIAHLEEMKLNAQKTLDLEKSNGHIPLLVSDVPYFPGMRIDPILPRNMNQRQMFVVRAQANGGHFAYLYKVKSHNNEPNAQDVAVLVKMDKGAVVRMSCSGICEKRISIESAWVDVSGLWFIKYVDEMADDVNDKIGEFLTLNKSLIDAMRTFVEEVAPSGLTQKQMEECGRTVLLNEKNENAEEWSFYVASVIYMSMHRGTAITSEWIATVLNTKDTVNRIDICFRAMQTEFRKTQGSGW